MPLPRLLLPLCGLLLALAVTSASAAPPPYAANEVGFVTQRDYSYTTLDDQHKKCESFGGSLVPMSTELVYGLVKEALDKAIDDRTFSFMGGSTMLSSSKCRAGTASLDCVWYWDQGRYAGVENAVAFYRGNRDTAILSDAGMMTTTVKNHWLAYSATEQCPCWKMLRYGAVLRTLDGWPYWSDASSTSRDGYDYSRYTQNYRLCLIDKTITTKRPVTSGVANRPLVVSLPVAVALAVMAVVAWL